ncbi:MAG TPA: N-formylglutamate amidohydrolase [Rhodopila sp.]|uniref:N-formylglutamate amidohydrolase n=1 Tax=Rhodopila sp. TaxID=2480087 RepID=UPI002C598695|nr:N-formylglutamate amidohydrolase [Rhodopila sp.]HVY17311.1 N-formylglutamate amidohydrolase [Rhodopila sp.]
MLLTPADPPPFEVLRAAGTSAFFLTGDHAGRAIPAALGDLGVPAAEMGRHIAWDIGIAGVTRHLSALLDATAVLQAYSRLVIDCNRNPAWPSAMPEVSEYTPVPGNAGLSDAGKQERVAEIFRPYHARIADLLDARAGRRTIFVAMHSFTPSFKGESRAMQVGVLYDKDARLAGIMLDLLRQEGDLAIGENAPYALTGQTDYSVPTHAESRGLSHLEIEIRQDLIADEAGQRAWAERFARLLPRAGAALAAA